MRTAALAELGERRPFLIAPAGPLETPLDGTLAVCDFLLGDAVAKAVARGFWRGEAGETLLVAPAATPFAALLLVGYGKDESRWDEACATAFAALPARLPGEPPTVAVLPPQPIAGHIPGRWSQAADRFIPQVQQRVAGVRRWLWFDAHEDDEA